MQPFYDDDYIKYKKQYGEKTIIFYYSSNFWGIYYRCLSSNLKETIDINKIEILFNKNNIYPRKNWTRLYDWCNCTSLTWNEKDNDEKDNDKIINIFIKEGYTIIILEHIKLINREPERFENKIVKIYEPKTNIYDDSVVYI